MSLPDPPAATLRLAVDETALAGNWRALDTLSGGAEAGAAIKADCYGLGIDRCLPVLRDAGAHQFFVAHWGEVAAAAKHVSSAQIAVLHGAVSEEEARYAREIGALPVINSIAQAKRWNETGGGPCHLMIDSGISRLGVALDELGDRAVQQLEIDLLLSHLASADEDSPMNQRQRERFASARGLIPHKAASLANSAGIALGPDFAFDLTRPGLALYGGVPRPELAKHVKQVARIEAAVIQRRVLKPGDAVGYNASFVAQRAIEVATVSIGYADGLLRSWAPKVCLTHNAVALPVLGKISMDMVVVDCSGAAELREGDWLELPYQLDSAAQQSGLSQYELLTVLGQRFGR